MLNLFLLFVPLAFILELMGASPTWVFLASALAIVPLAGWLGHATELIIAFFALLAGQAKYEGLMLLGVYIILAIAFFFTPGVSA